MVKAEKPDHRAIGRADTVMLWVDSHSPHLVWPQQDFAEGAYLEGEGGPGPWTRHGYSAVTTDSSQKCSRGKEASADLPGV